MRQKLLSVLLAVLVVCGIAIPAYAAESPVLSKECKVLSNTVIYNYVMLAAPYSRGVKGDAVYCRIVDRVRDDDGNAYQVADSAQLRDTTQFNKRIRTTTGGGLVWTITRENYDKDGFQGSSFCVKLRPEATDGQSVIEFESIYTARQDTVLDVIPTGGDAEHPVQLTVKKGAKITTACRLNINEETMKVTNYPESIPR